MMNLLTAIEIGAVVTGLVWIILLIKENIWCWIFGIISALLSIYLFYNSKLYSEAILYCYYVFISIYGWYVWSKKGIEDKRKIRTWSWLFHLSIIIIGIVLSYFLGAYFANNTDAQRPFHDSFSTIFSFIANLMEAKKLLFGWIYWIVLNAFSGWLYFDRGIYVYAGLMLIYFVLSLYGFISWKKSYDAQTAN
jgi:nicotinamide mononucleotide transporter